MTGQTHPAVSCGLTNSDFVLDPFDKLIASDAALDGKELAPRVDDIFDGFRDARPDPFSSSAEFVSRHRRGHDSTMSSALVSQTRRAAFDRASRRKSSTSASS